MSAENSLIGRWTIAPRRPIRSSNGFAEVQAAIEYEYRFAEYEYEQEHEYEVSLAPEILARGATNRQSELAR
jgi:hypothetical protein